MYTRAHNFCATFDIAKNVILIISLSLLQQQPEFALQTLQKFIVVHNSSEAYFQLLLLQCLL